jgi:hypothetical protein
MQTNGHSKKQAAAAGSGHAEVLHWPGNLLTTDDLRGKLNGQRELQVGLKTLVTPLVIDELKARGIKLVRTGRVGSAHHEASGQTAHSVGTAHPTGWRFASQVADGLIESVVAALGREGLMLLPLSVGETRPVRWARMLAESVAREGCGLVAFTADAALACCIANKLRGVRAASVVSVAQAKRVLTSLAPNLVAIEVPGPTFFEIKQIVRALCVARDVPAELAATLNELEASHAHR